MRRSDYPAELEGRTRLAARLVFDTSSHARPASSGLGQPASRHLLYECAGLCLDLRLDRRSRSATAVVAGQLADRGDPLKPISGLPVFLVKGNRLLARTTSDRLGEFQMEGELAVGTRVCLVFGNRQLIEVPVNPFIARGQLPDDL